MFVVIFEKQLISLQIRWESSCKGLHLE